ncbi:hypothetical protein BY996DRAFT_6597318 [Phakopsora pachyrhizi]|nr:hypothetical protein BY996DRAFT_6597318 [Phakopsora pachyrhizi]
MVPVLMCLRANKGSWNLARDQEDDPVDKDLFEEADRICRKANLKSLEDLGAFKGSSVEE